MLIACPECHRQMSDQAKACPHCGYMQQAKQPATMWIEATRKPYKISYVLAALLMLLGLACITLLYWNWVGAGLIAIGFIWLIVTNIRIWWHHG